MIYIPTTKEGSVKPKTLNSIQEGNAAPDAGVKSTLSPPIEEGTDQLK